MLNYLYLDYGGRARHRAELKYSLISLRAELDPARARIVVASDAPELYRRWPVRVLDIAPRIQEWSGDGLYYHRVKPALVRETLTLFGEPVLFLDSDSIIRPGFHAEAEEKMAGSVVMNRFEKHNPYPPLKGFRTELPHLGAYRYDVTHSWMFNSGLIGMEPAHLSLLDDTLAMIDALIGRAKKFPAIEQFALSEVLRLSQVGIAEIHHTFLHYWQGRRRIYMANRIARDLSSNWDDLTPPKQWADMNSWAVRSYNYYHGVTHVMDMFK
ncbi:MAG TPA: hypothetical protein VH019_05195 [Rhizomicrobium sp.]|jgi:hypothetical protein|nr:hypothetical protein [Rhizomicrobium sp.]